MGTAQAPKGAPRRKAGGGDDPPPPPATGLPPTLPGDTNPGEDHEKVGGGKGNEPTGKARIKRNRNARAERGCIIEANFGVSGYCIVEVRKW